MTGPVPRPADLDAVRDSYDRVAARYVELVVDTGIGDVGAHPWLRAAMDVFADAVRGRGPVLDVGCGPGQVTAHLVERGVDASGVDLSPAMVAQARRLHPHCRFAVGSATELGVPDGSLAGVLGWWSLFNLPRDVLPPVLASFTRALAPDGRLIMATHVGDGDLVRTEAYGGVPVRWITHLWQPEQLRDLIEGAGLCPEAEVRLPAQGAGGAGVVIVARAPGPAE
ncbi:class I SAM-dependent methyltransferase [Pseudonocardia sp. ICBG1293]|uniref:class I SAM-dependent DNA methyltransferase n=1 Tax=Pseudonocardia sp. ICBG1293 TaxID=2844382 RepID=UPI001CCC21C2|nr:class I SAM-dependent methyltransferase [Pseudonocardia sp. ICBG1293]